MKENQKTIETMLMLIGYLHSGIIYHSRRVSEFTKIILREAVSTFPEISLTEQEQECIVTCSLLHDMGENALPDSALFRRGKPDEKEQAAEELKSML